jgi:hypothetical protein
VKKPENPRKPARPIPEPPPPPRPAPAPGRSPERVPIRDHGERIRKKSGDDPGPTERGNDPGPSVDED